MQEQLAAAISPYRQRYLPLLTRLLRSGAVRGCHSSVPPGPAPLTAAASVCVTECVGGRERGGGGLEVWRAVGEEEGLDNPKP